jgi:hypothetical protein
MANWDKLNEELDSALDAMTSEEWTKWKNKNTITVCTGIGLNMFFSEYITIEIEKPIEKEYKNKKDGKIQFNKII